MTPKYLDSIDFLRRFHPGRRWVLTAISLDKRSITTATFSDSTAAKCCEWLETHGSTRNIYFSVGEVVRDVDKKAERTDIQNVWWFHVDLDPRAGEDIKAEQERCLGLLKSPKHLPKPTVIVYSGGGYQGFWALKEPIAVNCDLEKAEDAKRFNLQIELTLGADNVHDISRIMRLPGTVNRPDERKIKKGRVAVTSELVSWDESLVYAASDFQKAPETQAGGTAGTGGGFSSAINSKKPVVVSGNLPRFDSLDDPVFAGVNNKAKVVIAQGHDPDEPTKFQGRSEWLFYACCEMVRGGLTNEQIYSVITDPEWLISTSVLDKGSMTQKYALRQIERAQEDAVDPMLRELNERHAVISNIGGKCRVVEEQYDEALQRFRLTKQSFEDFANRYRNIKVDCGMNEKGHPVKRPLGMWWLDNEHRKQYDRLVFVPGRDIPGAYNLWRGFACEPKPGDCSLFLTHLEQNICQGNAEHYHYLMGWMARAVQKPDSPGYSSVVFRGGQGTGKSFVSKTFGGLFGRHYMQVTDPKHLVGSFNAHLRDCVVLFGDEAFYAGDKKHESILKMLITEETITVEAKGVDAEASNNCIHLMMASNEAWVVPAGMDDRRFFVLDVGSKSKNDATYFQALADQLANGGREALLHALMTYDISKFNVRQVPKTAALQEQKLYSMGTIEGWWMEKLREGQLLAQHGKWREECLVAEVHNDYLDFCKQFGIGRRGTAFSVRQSIESFLPKGYPEKFQGKQAVECPMPNGERKMIDRPYYYKFPTLEVARRHWDSNFGGPYDWPQVESRASEESKEKSPF